MILKSLRWRLVLTGAVAIIGSLGLSAVGLNLLFERHVERLAIAELERRALSIATMVEPDGPDGAIVRPASLDPIYDQPFSGRYWQLELGDEVLRSRSLWDFTLPASATSLTAGQVRSLDISGPRGEPLLAIEQALIVGDDIPLRIVVATDRDDLDLARRGFLSDLAPYLVLLVTLLVGASWLQISVGLRPLSHVSGRVAALNSGQRPRMGDDLPTEVLPLAHEIDTLLDARDSQLKQVRHRAADLAHGFKTPLQALLGDAAQLQQRNETEIANSIENVVSAMQRIVDRELARTRLQTDGPSAVAEPVFILERIVEVLRRTPDGAAIDWQIDGEHGSRAAINTDDLTEALGALMENAMRHATRKVRTSVTRVDNRIEILVGDDGPGVPEAYLTRLAQRGFRLDESGDGQGIGLALVADIIQSAGGGLSIKNTSPGLEVAVSIGSAKT